MPKQSSHPQGNFLFDDLAKTFEYTEQTKVPANDSLEQIQHDLQHTHMCGVCKPRMPIVFGIGPAPTPLMLIGEGPGIDNIESQQPFFGQAGVLLNRMLAAINQAWASVYICTVIKCIPPGERNFSVEEIEDCRPILLSPTRTQTPQRNQLFASLCAYVKLEGVKLKTGVNQFALKSKVYVAARKTTY